MLLRLKLIISCTALFVLTIICLGDQAFASQTAIIAAERAVIYADKQLLAPIGYVRQGKKILVGSVARQYGTIVPVAVAGRVAYIQIKDIMTLEQAANQDEDQRTEIRKGHAFYNTQTAKVEDNFKENNHFGIEVGSTSVGGDWKTLSDKLGQANPTFFNWRLLFEHRPLILRTSWSFGVFGDSASGTQAKFSNFGFDFQMYFSLLRNNLFHLDIGAGPQIVASAKLITKGPPEQEFPTSAWGWSAYGRMILFPHATISLHGVAYYRTMTYTNMENISIEGQSGVTTIEKIQSAGVYVGMSLTF